VFEPAVGCVDKLCGRVCTIEKEGHSKKDMATKEHKDNKDFLCVSLRSFAAKITCSHVLFQQIIDRDRADIFFDLLTERTLPSDECEGAIHADLTRFDRVRPGAMQNIFI